jgi:hypothetical protein
LARVLAPQRPYARPQIAFEQKNGPSPSPELDARINARPASLQPMAREPRWTAQCTERGKTTCRCRERLNTTGCTGKIGDEPLATSWCPHHRVPHAPLCARSSGCLEMDGQHIALSPANDRIALASCLTTRGQNLDTKRHSYPTTGERRSARRRHFRPVRHFIMF